LAADRAGIRFAEFCLDPNNASKIQKMASTLELENTFFPSITGLPEQITQQQFTEQGGLQGEYYATHLKIINQKINGLPVYLN
jgi:hypothetical protein